MKMFSASGMHAFSRRLGYLDTDEGRAEARSVVQANDLAFALNAQLAFSLPFYKYLYTPKRSKLFQAEGLVYK